MGVGIRYGTLLNVSFISPSLLHDITDRPSNAPRQNQSPSIKYFDIKLS